MKYLFNGCFFYEFLWEVEVAVVLSVLVSVSCAKPFYEGRLGKLGPDCIAFLLFLLHRFSIIIIHLHFKVHISGIFAMDGVWKEYFMTFIISSEMGNK
jgi:hypothetical protein